MDSSLPKYQSCEALEKLTWLKVDMEYQSQTATTNKKYIFFGVSRSALIFVQFTQVSNHKFPCGKFFF